MKEFKGIYTVSYSDGLFCSSLYTAECYDSVFEMTLFHFLNSIQSEDIYLELSPESSGILNELRLQVLSSGNVNMVDASIIFCQGNLKSVLTELGKKYPLHQTFKFESEQEFKSFMKSNSCCVKEVTIEGEMDSSDYCTVQTPLAYAMGSLYASDGICIQWPTAGDLTKIEKLLASEFFMTFEEFSSVVYGFAGLYEMEGAALLGMISSIVVRGIVEMVDKRGWEHVRVFSFGQLIQKIMTGVIE